jgi:serine/threonine-protein kinase RsbW
VVTNLPRTQNKYQLKIPSRADNLAIIRDVVSRVAQKAGFDSDEASKIELAVDEACTNVIKHAYGTNSEKSIDVLIKTEKEKLSIIVTDTGQGFDPLDVELPDLSQSIRNRKKGGLGLCLIKTLMDKVDFEIKPGLKNQVKMIKYIQ